MDIVTFPNGDVKQAPNLEMMEQQALCEWLPPTEELQGQMEEYAHWRNIQRAAASYGPHLIAMLMDSGALEPEQDPREALKDLLRNAGF